MHNMVTRHLKVTHLALGKVVNGGFTRTANYLRAGLNDLRKSASHGNYTMNSSKKVSGKQCSIKKVWEILMHLNITRHLKVTGLALGKIINGGFTRTANYLQTGLNDLKKLVSNGSWEDKVP